MTALAAVHADLALQGDLALRGGVAALLLLHLLLLALPGPRAAARGALAGLALSLLGYLVCQQPWMLLPLPRPLAYTLLALTVGTTGWLWASAMALFDDHFAWRWPVVAALVALVLLGLAANVPYFPDGDGPFLTLPADSPVHLLNTLHAAAMLGFSAAALWPVLRGWRGDLVATRRLARRWVALGIATYAALALVVELALRGRTVGPLLPALHVAGIGAVLLALAVWVARHSLAELLGVDTPPSAAPVAAPSPAVDDKTSRQLARLDEAMARDRLYRTEGLTLAALAERLGLGEAALRELINQRLGFRNFNDFLHHHRLAEAQARLVAEDLPVLSIALDCGYGSIGPFNRAFKQRFGLTPTEYRAGKRLLQPDANQ